QSSELLCVCSLSSGSGTASCFAWNLCDSINATYIMSRLGSRVMARIVRSWIENVPSSLPDANMQLASLHGREPVDICLER
ncbi:unnamed protein product, partial [Brassica oleracea var. botrytis]